MGRVVAAFVTDECPFLAGAVAYQIFFSLVPLLALVIGLLAFVYGPDRAAQEFGSMLNAVYPARTDQELRIVRQLVDGRAVSLGLGLIGTAFSASAIFGTIDTALAQVLGREGKRAFVRGRALGFGFVLALAAMAAISFAASYGVQAALDLMDETRLARPARLAVSLLSPLLGWFGGFAFFFLVYRLVPRQGVGAGAAARAALVSAVLWEVAKLAFALLTRGLGLFQAYGVLAFAAGLLTWIYVTSAIVLLGAEVIKTERR